MCHLSTNTSLDFLLRNSHLGGEAAAIGSLWVTIHSRYTRTALERSEDVEIISATPELIFNIGIFKPFTTRFVSSLSSFFHVRVEHGTTRSTEESLSEAKQVLN